MNDNRTRNNARRELDGMDDIVRGLLRPAFYHIRSDGGAGLPSLPALGELMDRLRAVFFPGFYSPVYASAQSLRHHLSANLDSVFRILAGQIACGLSLDASAGAGPESETDAYSRAAAFMRELPALRDKLEGDVRAAYDGDPAAKTPGETIFCYPSIRVMTNHRVAHELHRLGVPLIPRIISETAHAETGIDIHPGARIGDHFFIDHGTGVVIGETCIIGRNCRLYQGVTLGALSFPKDEDGGLTKGLPRHPVLEDDVVVYSGATILGRVTIGRGSLIGGNVWITRDIAPGSKVVQQRSTTPLPDESLMGGQDCL